MFFLSIWFLKYKKTNNYLEKCILISLTRYNKWDLILRGNVNRLRKKGELQRFRSLLTADLGELTETIVDLYDEFSDVAAHNNHYSVQYDEAMVTVMLFNCNITSDQTQIDAVISISRPIP